MSEESYLEATIEVVDLNKELLEALEEIIRILGGTCWDGCRRKDCRSVRVARAVIAKAKGEHDG